MKVDGPVFPSDLHALISQIKFHGFDPKEALIIVEDGNLEAPFKKFGDEITLVWFDGVNYLTGQYYDLPLLSYLCQKYGAVLGLDLAHAVGNVPLQLHEWGVDFAVWCHYKYLNGGPGTVGGAFVHTRHHAEIFRLAGWWGMPQDKRFEMNHDFHFSADVGANGWQLSTPPLLLFGALKASLDIFEEAGIERLREKSIQLTAHLEEELKGSCKILTPSKPHERGAQLSIRLENAQECFAHLRRHQIICDIRRENVIRITPVPLYNTLHDVEKFLKVYHKF